MPILDFAYIQFRALYFFEVSSDAAKGKSLIVRLWSFIKHSLHLFLGIDIFCICIENKLGAGYTIEKLGIFNRCFNQ
jgi:hypothetical protein